MSWADKIINEERRRGEHLDFKTAFGLAQQQCGEYMEEIVKAVIPEKADLPIIAAAYKMLGESFYGMLEDNDKTFCDHLTEHSCIILIPKEIE